MPRPGSSFGAQCRPRHGCEMEELILQGGECRGGDAFFLSYQVVDVQMLLVHPGEPRKGNAREGVWAPEPVHAGRCITKRIPVGYN